MVVRGGHPPRGGRRRASLRRAGRHGPGAVSAGESTRKASSVQTSTHDTTAAFQDTLSGRIQGDVRIFRSLKRFDLWNQALGDVAKVSNVAKAFEINVAENYYPNYQLSAKKTLIAF